MKNIGNILFVVAGCVWAIELIPQLVKTIRTKSVQDISIFFLSLCFIAYIIFLTGCFLIKNQFLFLSQLIPFINVGILLYLVLRYRKIHKESKLGDCGHDVDEFYVGEENETS